MYVGQDIEVPAQSWSVYPTGSLDAPVGHTDQHWGGSGPSHVFTSPIGVKVGTAGAAAFRHCRVGFIIRLYCDVCISCL